ncbi:PI-PLC domain-containing protein [Streptomyces sp. NPDC048290]|uniref:PI-PLC domain-containing protein n=1 Tax=Streptomyces sp. NPDC048290 TaxID=3155811 RepID=UPI003427D6D2
MKVGPVTGGRAVRITAFALAVVCTAVLATAATLRGTVLSPGFHQAVLDEEAVYDRLYNEVLVDPRTTAATRDLLARLPVPEAAVTSNIRLVLPPATLRELTHQQIQALVGYLNGDRDTLSLTVDVAPVLTNVEDVSHIYFGDLVSGLQGRDEPDFDRFTDELSRALGELADGRVPPGFPVLPLSEAQAAQAADVLLSPLPAEQRAQLRPEVEVALADGDIGTALAVVAPQILTGRTSDAVLDLRATAGGTRWDLGRLLDTSEHDLNAVHEVRGYTRLGLGTVAGLAGALLIGALVTLWVTGLASPGRRLMDMGRPLGAGGVLAGILIVLVRTLSGGRVIDLPATWPPSVARLVGDIQMAAFDRFTEIGLWTAVVPVAAGTALSGVGWLLVARPRMSAVLSRVRPLAVVAATTATAVAGTVLVPVAMNPAAERGCQGHVVLCDRPYDEVTYLTSHNAMSTTADRFIGPYQDPDITAQLDDGVRALQLDTYRWERSDQITARLEGSDFTAEQRALITGAVDTFNPPRAGLWLCHSVCRAGAVPLVPTLREIGGWMRDHPNDVVTLIIQDAIDGAETARAVEEAGLGDLVHTPDPDPDRSWPTLGEMIDSGRRLVVFAERADGPAPWYRNFYQYAMETPFAFRSPAEMSCAPNRGGTDRRLFLLNHFVTVDGGSRLDAGEVNARQFVIDRARACARERGRPVNFVAVDYATIGDAQGAVEELNARADDTGYALVQ